MDSGRPTIPSSSSYSQYSYEDSAHEVTSSTPSEQVSSRRSRDQRGHQRTSPLPTRPETVSYSSGQEEENEEDDNNHDEDKPASERLTLDLWNPRQSSSGSPRTSTQTETTPTRPDSKGKSKRSSTSDSRPATEATMSGTQHENQRDGVTYNSSNRDTNVSRAGSSTASSPRDGSQISRNDRKKDRNDKDNSRSRLVSGVFVRY